MSDDANTHSGLTSEVEPTVISQDDFRPQFDGLRPSYLPASSSFVISLYDHGCRCSLRKVLELGDCAELEKQALMHFAEAMCHALNAGIPFHQLSHILQGSASIAEDAKTNGEQGMEVFGFQATGMLVVRQPIVRYVLENESDSQVLLVTPDVSVKVTSASELLRTFNRAGQYEC